MYGLICVTFLALNIPQESVPLEHRRASDSYNTVAFTFAFTQLFLLLFAVVKSEQAREFAVVRQNLDANGQD